MVGLNNLLYSFLFIILFTISANAEWKMHSSRGGTFIYNTEDGGVFKYYTAVIGDNNATYDYENFQSVGFIKDKKIYRTPKELLENHKP